MEEEKVEFVRGHADLVNRAASMRPQIYLTPKPMLSGSDTHCFPGLFVLSFNKYLTVLPPCATQESRYLKYTSEQSRKRVLDPINDCSWECISIRLIEMSTDSEWIKRCGVYMYKGIILSHQKG